MRSFAKPTFNDLVCSVEDRKLFYPAETINYLNQRFSNYSISGSFFTIFYGVINLHSLALKYSRAGHPAPVVIHNDGCLGALDYGDTPVGLVDGALYEEFEVQLRKGDKLILYTDGLTDAQNNSDILFSNERFNKIMAENRHLSITKLVSTIIFEVADYIGSSQASDDIALLGLEIVT